MPVARRWRTAVPCAERPAPAAAPGAVGLTASLALVAATAPSTDAELTARGDLFITFNGGLYPGALPRDSLAPIEVRIEGRIRTLSGDRPPSLRRIEIALNRGGRLDSRGLERCRSSQIKATSTRQARRACRGALVGSGRFSADTAFPEQATFPTNGRVLAFNAIADGREAILAHIYGSDPVPITRIIVFYVKRTAGTYGTTLSAEVPAVSNRYGYVRLLSLRLHRNFTFHGRRRSYLSASCAAPRGFPGAVFPFARATFGFEGGATLSSVMTRTCRVRG